ncbi:MAG: hypothetical protein Q8R01_03585 [Ramlibacter sp.]|nr:hypothetical protein [Ramlibacter sp.]
MNHAIEPGLIPPEPGLEKEEPEQSHEEDIPADDGTAGGSPQSQASKEERPLRQVERE